MSVLHTDVIDIAPELSVVAAARINRFIQRAMLSVNAAVFGRKYELAVTYLAAHLLSRSPDANQNANAALKVTKAKVGELERTYSENKSSNTVVGLSETRYGDEFLRLQRECITTPLVVTQSGSV